MPPAVPLTVTDPGSAWHKLWPPTHPRWDVLQGITTHCHHHGMTTAEAQHTHSMHSEHTYAHTPASCHQATHTGYLIRHYLMPPCLIRGSTKSRLCLNNRVLSQQDSNNIPSLPTQLFSLVVAKAGQLHDQWPLYRMCRTLGATWQVGLAWLESAEHIARAPIPAVHSLQVHLNAGANDCHTTAQATLHAACHPAWPPHNGLQHPT